MDECHIVVPNRLTRRDWLSATAETVARADHVVSRSTELHRHLQCVSSPNREIFIEAGLPARLAAVTTQDDISKEGIMAKRTAIDLGLALGAAALLAHAPALAKPASAAQVAEAKEMLKKPIGFRTVVGQGQIQPYARYLASILKAGGFADSDIVIKFLIADTQR